MTGARELALPFRPDSQDRTLIVELVNGGQ